MQIIILEAEHTVRYKCSLSVNKFIDKGLVRVMGRWQRKFQNLRLKADHDTRESICDDFGFKSNVLRFAPPDLDDLRHSSLGVSLSIPCEHTLVDGQLEARFDCINPCLVAGHHKSPNLPPFVRTVVRLGLLIERQVSQNILKTMIALAKAFSKSWCWCPALSVDQ